MRKKRNYCICYCTVINILFFFSFLKMTQGAVASLLLYIFITRIYNAEVVVIYSFVRGIKFCC